MATAQSLGGQESRIRTKNHKLEILGVVAGILIIFSTLLPVWLHPYGYSTNNDKIFLSLSAKILTGQATNTERGVTLLLLSTGLGVILFILLAQRIEHKLILVGRVSLSFITLISFLLSLYYMMGFSSPPLCSYGFLLSDPPTCPIAKVGPAVYTGLLGSAISLFALHYQGKRQ